MHERVKKEKVKKTNWEEIGQAKSIHYFTIFTDDSEQCD